MSNADQVIDALSAVHDDLDRRVVSMTDDDLRGPSGASEWTVAQVLSHIGSGAEITRGTLEAALTGATPPDNQSVWDRWDAMSPQEQAEGARASDAALVARYEGLDARTRSELQITLGFLPAPVGLDLAGTLRLNEQALHLWDVAVATDDAATVHPAAVPVLLDGFAGPLGFMFGFLGKSGPEATLAVRTSSPDLTFTLRTGEQVALTTGEPSAYDGALVLPAEAFLRLVFGRLKPGRTPDGVSVEGPLDLAALRAVFPGF
jgi:uncharacterized protein (TIGR03083 family)